ncbi:formylglycine-generating enzyme family protein [Ectopseudomonas mendocina]|uniref:Formylglycine-generating enzyme family protein n=1 Tax=Ectopseudomonas mendocina TaxID=300 RepID=A0ABZ2RMG2_ECTME
MIGSKCSPPMLVALFFAWLLTTSASADNSGVTPALHSLADAMVWTSLEQCSSTYDQVLRRTQLAVDAVKSDSSHNSHSKAYIRFLKRDLSDKLESLTEEITYLRERCTAPDYDNSSVSLERVNRLNQMLQEWRATILWASKTIETGDYPDMYKVLRAETLVPVSHPQPGQTIRDCAESFCQALVVIPPGNFIMGGSEAEAVNERVNPVVIPWERPQHLAFVIKPFALSSTEVTLGAFRQFVKETGHSLPDGCTTLSPPSVTGGTTATLTFTPGVTYEHPGFAQTDDHPVVCVRVEDARAYAKWLSKKTGQHYRLPTETEWEYATRAGTQTTFFWGNNRDDACSYANVYDQTSDAQYRYGFSRFECTDSAVSTAPVASYQPNRFGLHDMLANAREWVDDCWHYGYESAPIDGSRWGEENGGLCRFGVLRGGAWSYNTANVRVAYRNAYLSSQARSFMWGFRLARDL